MAGEKWIVYWSEYTADTYLYGSEVIFHKKDDVEFRNTRMPPGTVIKQWYSRTDYQRQKIEPALPIIDGEGRYRICMNIDCRRDENYLVRLVFYDRYENETGTVILRDRTEEFRCPPDTYSYTMQLINGGVTEFRFHSIEIWETEDETEK